MSNPTEGEELDVEFPFPRDRDKDVADRPLAPNSLVGSYFRAPDPHDPNAEALWLDGEGRGAVVEGIVVAEAFNSAQTVVFLVEFYGRHGMSGHQELIEIWRMHQQHWAFFDNEAWLTNRPTDERKEVSSD